METTTKASAIVQTAGLTVSSILAAYATGGGSMATAAFAGGLTAISGVLGNYLVDSVGKSDAEKQALAAVLQNEHLAVAAANAVEHTIRATEGILDNGLRDRLAAAASRYWLKCQQRGDERTAPYAERQLATRISDYLTSDLADPLILLPQWKDILTESAADAEPGFDLPETACNALAGHLCREYPRRLYNAFKGDLEAGGAAFGGLVLRTLAELTAAVRDLRTERPQEPGVEPLVQRLTVIADHVVLDTEALARQLDLTAREARRDLITFHADLRRELRALREENRVAYTLTQQKLDDQSAMLAELRSMLAGGSPERLQASYEAALTTVAARHALSPEKLRTLLEDRVARLLRDPQAELLDKIQALRDAGQFVQARDFAIEAADQLERHRQASTDAEVEMLLEAAKSEIQLGHYTAARLHAERATVLADRERNVTLWMTARSQYGRTLSYLRHDHEAELLFRDLIHLRTLHLGPDHADTLSSRNNLAVVLRSEGKYAEAEWEHRAVLAIRERVLGAEHPDTLASRNNLANALDDQGKHAEAERENRAVLAIRERAQGAEHPDTLITRNNLATGLQDQSKHAEAEREHRAVLAIRGRVLGAEHPDTLWSWNNLANALYSQGKHAEAEREHRPVLAIRERVLGAEHPDTLSSRNNLAIVLHDQSKHAEAEREHQAILAIRERVLGAEHPDVFKSCYNLALCLDDQHKLPEAFEFSRRAYEGWKKVLGEEHPSTKWARDVLERIEREAKKEGGDK